MKKIALMLIFSMILCGVPSYAAEEFTVKADGSALELKNKPIIADNTVYLPVREVFEGLGMTVEWNGDTNEITASANDFDFVLKTGSDKAVVDKVSVELSSPVRMENDMAYVSTELFDDYMKYCTEQPVWEDKNTLCIKKPEIIAEEEFDQRKVLESLTGGETVMDMDMVFSAKANSDKVKLAKVNVSGQSFANALEAQTLEQPTNIYDIQLVIKPKHDILAGEVAALSYCARKISTTDESGMGYIGPCYEENYGDYTKLASVTQELDEEWQRYYVLLAPRIKNFPKDKCQFTLRLGFKPQTIQLADLKIINYHTKYKYDEVAPNAEPDDTYHGMEDDALWRKEALKRIEKNRKRDITVNVKTEGGTPLYGANVSVDMTKNEFMFGTAVHNTFLQSGTSEKAVKYREAVLELFNTVVYDTAGKWPTIEPNKGVYASGILNWANKNNITVRGHALFWDQLKYLPPSLQKAYPYMSDEQLKNRITEHVNDVMTQYKGAIPQWDVLNEPLNNNVMLQRLGYGEIVRHFNLAKAIDPNASLYVNETGIAGRDAHWNNVYKLYNLVKNAKDAGAKIDGIGIQTHCGGAMSYPQSFYNQLDYLSELVDEIAITEYDFTPKREELEAPYLRDMLITAYSHPKCTGFITWGFWDSQHWKNHAPFYKPDWTARDTVAVWKKYVQGEWETHESGTTNSDGIYKVRGHRGEYDVTVTYANKTYTGKLLVTENGANTAEVTVGADGIRMTVSEKPREYLDVDINGLYKYRTDFEVDDKGNVSGSGEKYELSELPEAEDLRIIAAAEQNKPQESTNTQKPIIESVFTDGTDNLSSLTDSNSETSYCARGEENEITIKLRENAEVKSLTVNWYENKIYAYNYEILISEDGEKWEPVSSGRSKTRTESYPINKKCGYIRLKSQNPTGFFGITDIAVD